MNLVVNGDPVKRGVTLQAGDVRVYVTATEARFVVVGTRGGETVLFKVAAAQLDRVSSLLSVVKTEQAALKPAKTT